MRDFITILCTKFQRCTVDLAKSPKITTLLHRIVDGKVTRIERLNEFQLRAQTVRLYRQWCNQGVNAGERRLPNIFYGEHRSPK